MSPTLSVTEIAPRASRRLKRCEVLRVASRAGIDQRRVVLEAALCLALPVLEVTAQHVDIGDLETVDRGLAFVFEPHLAVGHAAAPLDVVDRVLALEEHRDALEAVGELGRDRRELDAAGLLEVGELGDLHAVEQHLPADAPGAEGRRLPVVLFEADVVHRRIDADGSK